MNISAISGILIGQRRILLGDERALLPEELAAFETSVDKVRRASGAARIVARELLVQLGLPPSPLPKSPRGMPVWPDGVLGSMAHDSSLAVAAAALSRDFVCLGIDVEPAEPLPPDLLDLVATRREREKIELDPYGGRLLFTAKEAVYKAVYPIDHVFLEHHDVEIDFTSGTATVRNSRIVKLHFSISAHLLAVAYLPTPV
jgi:4'-phosphopantetheinyl transferase EntD